MLVQTSHMGFDDGNKISCHIKCDNVNIDISTNMFIDNFEVSESNIMLYITELLIQHTMGHLFNDN